MRTVWKEVRVQMSVDLTIDEKNVLVNDLINVVRMNLIKKSDLFEIEDILQRIVMREIKQTGDIISVLKKYDIAKRRQAR